MAIQDLYDKPGYQIRRLRQIAAGLFAAEAAPFGITGQQWTTLQALGEFPRLEQGELCDVLSLDRATMATLLVRLEEKGLVRRTTSDSDRRRKHVALTPRGRRTLADMAPLLDRIQERILEPLAPADRLAFGRMLKTLVDTHSATPVHHPTTHEEAS
jgi:MarR family transcriptional regulator, lower aerobic nicotinate degradation pathway regulator